MNGCRTDRRTPVLDRETALAPGSVRGLSPLGVNLPLAPSSDPGWLLVEDLFTVLVVVMLARLYLPLALLTATAVAPLMLVSAFFRRRYGLVTRRVQDQQGDLTTTIEESAVGIRVVTVRGSG